MCQIISEVDNKGFITRKHFDCNSRTCNMSKMCIGNGDSLTRNSTGTLSYQFAGRDHQHNIGRNASESTRQGTSASRSVYRTEMMNRVQNRFRQSNLSQSGDSGSGSGSSSGNNSSGNGNNRTNIISDSGITRTNIGSDSGNIRTNTGSSSKTL